MNESNSSQRSRSSSGMDRFLREARSVAQLRHPAIVSVHEVGEADGVAYLVSDLVQGVTLTDLLTARRPSFRDAAELVAAALLIPAIVPPRSSREPESS